MGRILVGLAVVVLAGYFTTVGVVPATLMHTGDSGRLQWLIAVPGGVSLLEGTCGQHSSSREFRCSIRHSSYRPTLGGGCLIHPTLRHETNALSV